MAFRWVVLVALLVGECVAWTVCFDVRPFGRSGVWWGDWLHNGHWIGHAAIVGVLTTGVVLTIRLRRRLSPEETSIPLEPPSWLWLVPHAFTALFCGLLTPIGLRMVATSSPQAQGWFLIGVGLSALSFAFWLLAGVPTRLWPLVGREGAGALAWGVVLSVTACAAAFLANLLWNRLGWVTLSVVRGVLDLFPVEVVADPSTFTLGTKSFQVKIAPVCAGYEGMGLMLVLLLFLFWVFRRELRFPHAFVLLPMGIATVWLLNAVRITALILIGSWGYPHVAVGGFHSQAGWLAFNAVGFSALIVIHRWSFIRRMADRVIVAECVTSKPATAGNKAESLPDNTTLAYLAPLLALVLASMVGEALGDGVVRFYPLRVFAVLFGIGLGWSTFSGPRLMPSRSLWALAVGIGVFVVWLLLEPKSSGSATAPVAANTAWGTIWLMFRVLGSVVCVPLAEELAFRGYLLRRLISHDFQDVDPARFTWLSFLGSSVLFGLLHGRWLAGTLAGMAYAGAVYRHRRLGDAIAAHAVTNGLIAAWVLLFDAWSLWQ